LGEIIDNLVIFSENEQIKKKTGEGINKLLALDDSFIKRGMDPITFFFYDEIVKKKLHTLLTMNLPTT